MDEQELRVFLRVFHNWREQASGHIQRSARTRMLFLCLLIRHAGLRLGEALAFDDNADMDVVNCSVYVRNGARRRIPISRRAMAKLEELRESPAVLREKGILCHMDPGYVRRVFEARGRDAGLSFRVNPSLIRHAREEELRGMGVSPQVSDWLFGRGGEADDAVLKKFPQSLQQWERERQAGRHNTFCGEIVEQERREFCTRIVMQTEQGLTVYARCSTRTAVQLELEVGLRVMASFRSLQGRLSLQPEERNSFRCHVVELYVDGDVKVMLELSAGGRCCAVAEAGYGWDRLSPGQEVWLNVRDSDFLLSTDLPTV